MPRSRLGPLAIESKLGDNPTTSSVWRAVHVQQKRAVAVKIFPAPFGGTPEARNEFSGEWEQLKHIQHAAIAKCFGGGFEGADAYLAHELIDGDTLESQLNRMNRLSWESVLDLAEPLADALHYLHRNNLVHGAIKPDKIMIAGLSPVLLDVRVNRATTPYKSNRPASPQETALLAPELLANPDGFDQHTDMYALGAAMYWAITGTPPVAGSTVEEVRGNVEFQTPISPASVILDCPIWLDKLVSQLLEKDPAARPASAHAVKLALGEVRKRAMSRTGVAEHVSSGFSPLQMTDQQQRDEARTLLGREVVDLEKVDRENQVEDTVWHENAWVLVSLLALMLGFLAWVAWPPNQDNLRTEAERLIADDSRGSLRDARDLLANELLQRFPDGEHAPWAKTQVERIDVRLFLHQLAFKIKNNLDIDDQGELLHKQAELYAKMGDTSKALDKYRSIVTVLGDNPKYRIATNAARAQIAVLENSTIERTEASEIVEAKLAKADRLLRLNHTVEAREIWYSLIESYGENSNLSPLIKRAQDRLREN